MEAKLTGNAREWNGEQVSPFVNYRRLYDWFGEPNGLQVAIESDSTPIPKGGAIYLTLGFNEARLLAHRLLVAVGDRV